MTLIISPQAEKKLKKIPKFDQIAIAKKIRSLTTASENHSEEKLSGNQNIYRVRVGDYRIVYRRSTKSIYIILLGHRKDIYELLNRLIR